MLDRILALLKENGITAKKLTSDLEISNSSEIINPIIHDNSFLIILMQSQTNVNNKCNKHLLKTEVIF